MGSRYGVRVVMSPGDEAANERIRAAIARELALVDRLFSGWSASSEISRLNAHASSAPFAVSPETLQAVELARRASEISGGAFDATVAPLVAAWGFGPEGGPKAAPNAEALAAARARVGYRLLQLDRKRSSVTKSRPDVACDVSALAGGWAADRIAAAILALGHQRRAGGRGWRGGGAWPARGRRPLAGRRRVAGPVPRARAGASSWRTRRSPPRATTARPGRTREGRRRSHILDPRTGEPIAHELASVSVVDRDGAWADALATALLVLGPQRAARWRCARGSPRASSSASPTAASPSGRRRAFLALAAAPRE